MRIALRMFAVLAAAALVLQAPAQAQPAVPYVEQEVTVPVPAAHRLSGTLTLPPTMGPHPAVVLISGSGPQNRDEEIGIPGYRPFRVCEAAANLRAGLPGHDQPLDPGALPRALGPRPSIARPAPIG